jgi:site-specific DNA recombinase
MIVALYARVSTTKQAEKDLSIPDQIRQIKGWCERQGHIIATEYIEEGASATDDRRPVFQKMINEACSDPRPFDMIVVHSLSRFFRDSFEFAFYERKLNKAGIKLVSITQQTGEDPAGEMARKVFNIFDEYQSKENSKHTLRAMVENARQGYFNGSSPPYGYKAEEVEKKGRKGNKRILVIDAGESRIVRKIFDLYLRGDKGHPLGMYGIAYYLNEHGIGFRGGPWNSGHINRILSDPVYKGEYYFNKKVAKTGEKKPPKEWVLIRLDPIIDEATFREVEERRAARNPSKVPPRITSSPTLLTGILKCGYCGSAMTLATGKGGKYRYYKCTARIKKGAKCESGNVPTEKLDSLVLNSLADRVFTPLRVGQMIREVQSRLFKSKGKHEEELAKLNRRLDEIKKATERLYDAVERGLLPPDSSLQERAHKLSAERQAILTEIAGIRREQEMRPQVFSERNIEGFCRALRAKLLDRKSGFGKGYLKLLVDEIRVKGRKVNIRGTYSALAQAVSTKKLGDPGWVPSFRVGWLTRKRGLVQQDESPFTFNL